MPIDTQYILMRCRQADIRLIRFLYCDNGGVIRGKATPIEQLQDRLTTGMGLTVAMQAMNMLDQPQPVERMGPVGEIRLVPDPDSFVILPYAHHSAAMTSDMITLGREAWGACPRTFLKRMEGRLRDRGMSIQAAFENEFSLLERKAEGGYEPIDRGLCFSSVSMTAADDFIHDVIEALKRQDVLIDAYYPELGHGQHELPVRHDEPMRAADNQVWVRETVRNVAAQRGWTASFAPKPIPDQAGNGCHLHWSLWDPEGKTNLLYDSSASEDTHHLSELGKRFTAGVLAHLPGLLGLSAPSYNSYRRLQPNSWSSAYVAWGPDNREASVRVVSGRWGSEASTLNLELKPCDASSNPYLALGGLIAAGIDGIDRELDPPEPCFVNPTEYSDSERRRRGMDRYPETQAAALDALESDELLMKALGPELSRSYLAVKRSENAAFAAEDEAFEIEHHLSKF